jgi:hypothetical protein
MNQKPMLLRYLTPPPRRDGYGERPFEPKDASLWERYSLPLGCGGLGACVFGYPDEDTSMEALLMGGSVEQVPEICAELTPIHFVDEDCPPIFLYHGMLDKATPYLQSVEFAEKAAEKTGDAQRVQYKLLETTGHSNGQYKEQWLKDERLEFLKKYL